MKHGHAKADETMRRLLRITCLAALTGVFTALFPQPLHAADIEPLPVAPNLEVPAGNQAFLEGHAVGTQNYICLPCPNPATSMCPDASGFAWILFTPQATLFNGFERQIITHFLSPNPDENGTARATWQHSRDTSTVWAMAVASSSDPDFVASEAIPWLLLQIVGAEPGPRGGARLTRTTFIQRLHTAGGIAPSSGCAQSSDVGQRTFVPYTADYVFYKAAISE
jgi:hypothetical protein